MAELTGQQKQAAGDAWDKERTGTKAIYSVYAAGLAEGAKPQPASADDAETVHCLREAIRDVDGHRPSRPAAESALVVARRGWVQAGTETVHGEKVATWKAIVQVCSVAEVNQISAIVLATRAADGGGK